MPISHAFTAEREIPSFLASSLCVIPFRPRVSLILSPIILITTLIMLTVIYIIPYSV